MNNVNSPLRTVIQVDHVSKTYWHKVYRPSLRHEPREVLKRVLGQFNGQEAEAIGALQDVNFTVAEGEAISIVGRNGAGKSTLLRILGGIVLPTSGNVSVQGDFACLIALGTGFNPERTGRQNIYLSAALQGKTPAAIETYIEDIIAFAELEQFIDMPVKRYSSGMYSRLGFSIAFHVLPDIIMMDETLAVGDFAFQEKCIDRIAKLKAAGKTLLLVSHDLDLVRTLSDRSLWLDRGALIMDGPVDQVIGTYESSAVHHST